MPTNKTTGRPTQETLEHELEVLTRQRARLLVDDPDGEALRLVKARLAMIEDALQDLALVDEETQRRSVEAEATARREREAEARAQATALQAELRVRAATVDTALTTLVRESQAFQRVEQALTALVATLPPPVPTRPSHLALASTVLWGLNPVLGHVLGHHVPRPHHALRKPLSELVGPVPAAPTHEEVTS